MSECFMVFTVCERSAGRVAFFPTEAEAVECANQMLKAELIASGVEEEEIQVGEDGYDYGWCSGSGTDAYISDGNNWDAHVVSVPVENCPDLVMSSIEDVI